MEDSLSDCIAKEKSFGIFNKTYMTYMTNKTYKKIAILLAVFAVLAISGYVAALNGYFGGGAAIPEDTMTRGLVGYWSFDEGAGQTAKDLSNNGNNGRLGAAATAGADDPLWTKGKNGGGLKFDGKNDYVGISKLSLVDGDSFTVVGWVNYSVANEYVVLISEGVSTDVATDGFHFYRRGNNDMTFTVGNGTAGVFAQYDLDLFGTVTNRWFHVVGVYNNATGKASLYINGVFKAESAVLSGGYSTYSALPPKIGRLAYTAAYYMNGTIDDVRIYNRALSAEEVSYHYNHGGPVAEWKFDEGSGTTTYDSSGNEYDGVLHE